MSHAKQLHHRRSLHDSLEILNREGLPGTIQSDLCLTVQDTVVTTVQHVIEEALEEELSASLGVARYAPLPWGRPPEATRRGSYQRALITQYGRIAALRVPKLRRGNGALPWQSITRYEHCWGPLLDHHVMGSCLGHSLRDVPEAMALPLGERLSLAACHRMGSSVAKPMEACKTPPLATPPPLILVDGMWVKIAYPPGEISEETRGRRRAVKRKQKRVVLRALGVWPDGQWDIVPWQIATGETADTWKAFLGDLSLKGITETTTPLVVSDGAPGLESAVDYHLHGVAHPRCIFHQLKQLADHLVLGALAEQAVEGDAQATRKTKRRRQKAILVDASKVYEGTSEAALREQADVFRETWHGRESQAVANFLLDFDKTFAYWAIDFPPPLASLIRTTNLLERFHKEMRRKQHDIGMFQSEQGCEVLWDVVSMRETVKQRAAVQT
jgi:transposase-like protein